MFSALIYKPLYNGLVLLMELFPFFDLGVIIVLFTIIVKLILFPLSLKAITAQQKLKEVEPEIKNIREKYKDNREQQALKTLELYREKNIKPFSGLLVMLVQLPILFGLYYIFIRSGLPVISADLLYSFVPVPDHEISTQFLTLVDATAKSIPLALIAGVVQFFQTKLSMPPLPQQTDERSFGNDFARSLSFQMKYIFPILVIFIAYTSAGLALYLVTSSLFHMGQELFVKNVYLKKTDN
jgi:YidC/Oxa1 family membrane protein insertase